MDREAAGSRIIKTMPADDMETPSDQHMLSTLRVLVVARWGWAQFWSCCRPQIAPKRFRARRVQYCRSVDQQ